MPGHLFEGNPVGEGTTRRGTAIPVHRLQRPAGSTHSSTRGLRPPEPQSPFKSPASSHLLLRTIIPQEKAHVFSLPRTGPSSADPAKPSNTTSLQTQGQCIPTSSDESSCCPTSSPARGGVRVLGFDQDHPWDFVAVQWLRRYTSTSGDAGSIPG